MKQAPVTSKPVMVYPETPVTIAGLLGNSQQTLARSATNESGL